MRQGGYFSLLLKSVPLATWVPDILDLDFLRRQYLVVQALRRKNEIKPLYTRLKWVQTDKKFGKLE